MTNGMCLQVAAWWGRLPFVRALVLRTVACACTLSAALLLCSCLTAAGTGYFVYSSADQSPRDPYTPELVASIKKKLRYHKVTVHPFGADDGVDEPWQKAVSDCSTAAIEFLRSKGIFESVEEAWDAFDSRPSDPDTMLVDANVQSMRIVSRTGRALAGLFAGTSEIALVVIATNSKGIASKRMVSGSNIRARTWINPTDGDEGLPSATGILVADAIIQLAQ
jgi:hypothetical protein